MKSARGEAVSTGGRAGPAKMATFVMGLTVDYEAPPWVFCWAPLTDVLLYLILSQQLSRTALLEGKLALKPSFDGSSDILPSFGMHHLCESQVPSWLISWDVVWVDVFA